MREKRHSRVIRRFPPTRALSEKLCALRPRTNALQRSSLRTFSAATGPTCHPEKVQGAHPLKSWVSRHSARKMRALLETHANVPVPQEKRRAHARRQHPKRRPEENARRARPDFPRCRRHYRHRHFRADRHRRRAGRPGADAVVHHRGHRLRLRSARLCRVRLDHSGRRLDLHLFVRHARRTGRVDHRLGPDARIRAGHVGRVGRLVGLSAVAAVGLRRNAAGRAVGRARRAARS